MVSFKATSSNVLTLDKCVGDCSKMTYTPNGKSPILLPCSKPRGGDSYCILPCHGKRKQVQSKVKMTYRYHFGSRSKSNTINYINSYYCMWFWLKSRDRKKHVQVVLENSKAKRSKSMRLHQPIVRVNSDRFQA